MSTKKRLTKDEKREIAEAEADLAYWKVIEGLIPDWKVMGWTYRRGATFVTPGQYSANFVGSYTDTLNMTGAQRDDIVKAFERAEQFAQERESEAWAHCMESANPD